MQHNTPKKNDIFFLKSLSASVQFSEGKFLIVIRYIGKEPHKIDTGFNCGFYICQNNTASTYKLMLL